MTWVCRLDHRPDHGSDHGLDHGSDHGSDHRSWIRSWKIKLEILCNKHVLSAWQNRA